MNAPETRFRTVLPAAGFCLCAALSASGGTPLETEGDWDYAMSTDRPDITESPFTVKRGHWQFEMETVSVSLDGHTQSEDWGSVNIKYGLSFHTDIQLVTPAWHTGDGKDGWTDPEIRFKWNLAGRERLDGAPADSDFALALMPYIKLPTASGGVGNNNVDGGLIVPFAFAIGEIPLGAMIQADFIRNEADDGYTGALTLSATHGFDLTGRLSAFTEAVATLPLDGPAETYLNGGFVYELNRNWHLDAGVNIGLNGDAEDVRFFTGMSFRY